MAKEDSEETLEGERRRKAEDVGRSASKASVSEASGRG